MPPRTIAQWRSAQATVEAAQKLLTNPALQQMLSLVRAHNPVPSLPLTGTQSNDFTYSYGIIVGWQSALSALEALGEPMPEPSPLTPDFSPNNNTH